MRIRSIPALRPSSRRWFVQSSFAALSAVLIAGAVCSTADAAKIEAVKGKRYELTKHHGPWMIMVASFRDIDSRVIERKDGRLQYVRNERYEEGMSALEAADSLVYEMRVAGIPAYIAVRDDATDRAQTADRRGRPRTRSYRSRLGGVAVLAGNYKSFENSVGQQTLRYVKNKLHSQVLANPETGAVYRPTPGQSNPLSGAFLTLNPLLSAKGVQALASDPVIKQLNSGIEYSLAKNPGKYTLIIASFNGRSMKKVSDNNFSRFAQSFDRGIGDSLDTVAEKSWRLTQAMRSAKRAGYENDFEVYVWHDHFRSLVTIGSFDSPRDPRIARYVEMFRAKARQNPNTGRSGLEAEIFTVPRRLQRNEAPKLSFMFDPNPSLMEVPRLN